MASSTTRFATRLTSAALTLSALLAAPSAFAGKDVLEVGLTAITPAHASLSVGGTPMAVGGFSGGNIVLQFTHAGTSFPSGTTTFGGFVLKQRLVDRSAASGQDTTYGSGLSFTADQQGTGGALQLGVAPVQQTALAAGAQADRSVAITVACNQATPCTYADGDTLTANIHFAASNELDTSVKVMVKVKLVAPPTQCLSFYNFVTDQDLTTAVTRTDVGVVASGRNAGRVTSTMPFGQLSDNVLVVNSCGTAQQFDLDINLDPSFDTNPHDNPGNAVFTYAGSSSASPANFDLSAFGEGTPQGQVLCLANVSVGANSSFLATVHMGIRRGMAQEALTPNAFLFTAGLHAAGTACAGAPVAPGTAGASVGYTIK